MPDSLDALEADRSKLLQKFLTLGDLRPGSVTAVVRRCVSFRQPCVTSVSSQG